MSKSRIVMSVLVLTVLIAAAGLVGASVFPAASEAAMGIVPTMIPDESKPDNKDAEENELRTVSKDSECDEITHPKVIKKVNPKYPDEARKARKGRGRGHQPVDLCSGALRRPAGGCLLRPHHQFPSQVIGDLRSSA